MTRPLAVTVTVIGLAVAGALVMGSTAGGVTAPPAPSCDTTWASATSGSWFTASNWTNGVPTSTENACIPFLGANYTVSIQGSAAANTVTIGTGSTSVASAKPATQSAASGGTPTLAVQGVPSTDSYLNLTTSATVNSGAVLDLDSQSGGGNVFLNGGSVANYGTIDTQNENANNRNNVLRSNLTNEPGATTELKSGNLYLDSNNSITNNGTLITDAGSTPGALLPNSGGDLITNNGTVTNNGTITLSGNAAWDANGGSVTGNPVTIDGNGTLTDAGTGASGSYDLVSGTVTLAGTIASGETVSVLGQPGYDSYADLGGTTVTNKGTLILDSQNNGGNAVLQHGTLTNDGTFQTQNENANNRNDYLRANLVNATGATTTLASGNLFMDSGNSIANSGSLVTSTGTNPGTLMATNGGDLITNNQNGSATNHGAITLSGNASWNANGGSESGNPVTIDGNGTLTDAGTGKSGTYDLINGTVTVAGTIASGESVAVLGQPGFDSYADLGGKTVTNNGTFVLDSQNNGGNAFLQDGTLTNNGTFDTQNENGNSRNDYLRANLTNASGATMELKSGNLIVDSNTSITNSGTLITDAPSNPGALLATSGGDLITNNGTVTNHGTIALSGNASWNANGGSVTGNPVTISANGALTDVGTGKSGTYDLINGTVTVTGTIASGETVAVLGQPGFDSYADLGKGTLKNKGLFLLDSQSSGGNAFLQNGTLDNSGTFDSQNENLNNRNDYLRANLINEKGATTELKSGNLIVDSGNSITNSGTLTTDNSSNPGTLLETTGETLTNNGSVTNNGAITLSGGASWDANGGSESANPVTIEGGGTLTDAGTGKSGSYDLVNNTVTLAGTIATGETVSVLGQPGYDSYADLGGTTVTNNGTLVLDSQSGGGNAVLQNGTLTNKGSFETQNENNNSRNDYLRANLANANGGTLNVASGNLLVDSNNAITNDGTVVLGVTGNLDLDNGGDTFTQNSDGALSFDIASATSFGMITLPNGNSLTLKGGTVNPVLEGTYAPPVGTEFDVIVGPHTGTFTTVTNNFTADYEAGYIGLVRGPDSTTLSLSSSTNPSTTGQSVTFTATLTPGPGAIGNPTGTVTFYDNGTSIGTGSVMTSNGATFAQLTTSSLPAGNDPITASYGATSNFGGSSSNTVTQVVTNPTPTPGTITCQVTKTYYGSPAAYQQVTVNASAGIASIYGVQITNGTVSYTTPSGNPTSTVVTATKTNQSQRTYWSFYVKDAQGQTKYCG